MVYSLRHCNPGVTFLRGRIVRLLYIHDLDWDAIIPLLFLTVFFESSAANCLLLKKHTSSCKAELMSLKLLQLIKSKIHS
jgi:hypothetical protein